MKKTVQSVSFQMCVLQNFGLVLFLGLFAVMFGYMISYEHDRDVFHHDFLPYNCTVLNMTDNMLISVDNHWTVVKPLNCSEIFKHTTECINKTFVGYFDAKTHQLQVTDRFALTLIPEMIIFGLMAVVILAVACATTCALNKSILQDHKERERLLI